MTQSHQPPEPGPEHKCLDIFVGRWNTEGEMRADPSGGAIPFTATDTYEWLPSGLFLLHRVDARMGENEVKVLEVIGWDPSIQSYSCRSFDTAGNAGAYRASLTGRAWKIWGDTERFSGMFSEDGNSLSGTWERHDGSCWLHWMEVTLTRDTSPTQ